jgi:acetyltransferase-like isoleucine patch superfamily enzyme
MDIKYIWSKLFKKIQSKSILRSKIHATSKIEAGSNIVDSVFDKHSFCGYNCEISNTMVGSFCSISNNVKIGGGMHPLEWVSTSPAFYFGRDSIKAKFSAFEREAPKKTIIGHDVWIGQNVLIGQGLKIGNGAVIGMGSIVTKDVEPYSIVAGNPARKIKQRFKDEIIDMLNKSKWWELDESILKKLAIHIKNPQKFIFEINKKIDEI